MQRNREDATDIQKNIEMSATIKTDLNNRITIDNNTSIEEIGAILIKFVINVE